MRKWVALIFFMPGILGYGADTLSLWKCYEKAEKAHPLSVNPGYYRNIHELDRKNIQANWYPKLDLHGQATYQSQVVKIGDVQFEIPAPPGTEPQQVSPDFPSPSKDQYKVYLEMNQNIYDGGATKKQKALENAGLLIQEQKINVEIKKIKNQVTQVYFAIMAVDKNQEVANLFLEELEKQLQVVSTSVKNGVLLPSDKKVLQAEIMKSKQQMEELRLTRAASLRILERLIGDTLSEPVKLQVPGASYELSPILDRPEEKLFDLQQNSLETGKELAKTQRFPKVFAFSQLGYGRPGLNMLSDEFDSFYLIGAGFKWNIWDWNQAKHEQQKLDMQKNILEAQRQTFERGIRVTLDNQLASILKFEKMIQTDKDIIQLRAEITKSAKSQLENGIIHSTEYLHILNQEKKARLDMEIHRIQLEQAKMDYNVTSGKPQFSKRH